MDRNRLVDIKSISPAIICDSRYATENNFLQKKIYTSAVCYLIEEAAYALKRASDELSRLGYRIKIWDAYRPFSIQQILWNAMPDKRYVADPKKGSRHNRGCALDLTLVNEESKELDMGTDFDDFTQRARRSYKNLPTKVLKNRQLLQDSMENNQFIGWEYEWWHFDFEKWQEYPLLDRSFEDLKNGVLIFSTLEL